MMQSLKHKQTIKKKRGSIPFIMAHASQQSWSKYLSPQYRNYFPRKGWYSVFHQLYKCLIVSLNSSVLGI